MYCAGEGSRKRLTYIYCMFYPRLVLFALDVFQRSWHEGCRIPEVSGRVVYYRENFIKNCFSMPGNCVSVFYHVSLTSWASVSMLPAVLIQMPHTGFRTSHARSFWSTCAPTRPVNLPGPCDLPRTYVLLACLCSIMGHRL